MRHTSIKMDGFYILELDQAHGSHSGSQRLPAVILIGGLFYLYAPQASGESVRSPEVRIGMGMLGIGLRHSLCSLDNSKGDFKVRKTSRPLFSYHRREDEV